MKRTAVLAALFLAGSLAALGAPRPPRQFFNPLLDDVVAMTRAGIPDVTIVAYLRARRLRLESDVTAEDLVRLRREGVGDPVLQYIASQSGVEAPPPLPPLPIRWAEGSESENPPQPADPNAPDPSGSRSRSESRAVDPDPGDVGLIMGVYDTIPEDGYPCWPPSLAPYECGGGPIFVDGMPVTRRGDSPQRRRPQDRTARPEDDRGRGETRPSGGRISPGGRSRR